MAHRMKTPMINQPTLTVMTQQPLSPMRVVPLSSLPTLTSTVLTKSTCQIIQATQPSQDVQIYMASEPHPTQWLLPPATANAIPSSSPLQLVAQHSV